jgi:hypothetical protein
MLRILLMDEEEQNQICSMIDRELSGLSERQTQPGRNKTAMTEEAPIELFAILDEIREKYGITDEEWAKGAGMSLNGVETFRQMALGQKKVH